MELMVAMTIGLLLILIVGYFYLGSRQSSRASEDVSLMQDEARFALETMGRSIRQAGYRTNIFQTFSAVPLSGTEGSAGTTDTITVRYDVQPGGERNCAGSNVASGVMTVSFSVNTNRQLICTVGTTTATIAEGVENMQISYGIDTGKDGKIESYQTASGVTDFSQVAVVAITLTMRGQSKNGVGSSDGYIRQTYQGSFTVRNQAG